MKYYGGAYVTGPAWTVPKAPPFRGEALPGAVQGHSPGQGFREEAGAGFAGLQGHHDYGLEVMRGGEDAGRLLDYLGGGTLYQEEGTAPTEGVLTAIGHDVSDAMYGGAEGSYELSGEAQNFKAPLSIYELQEHGVNDGCLRHGGAFYGRALKPSPAAERPARR